MSLVEPVAIWIEGQSPRARYAADQLFTRLLGWSVRWAETTDELDPEARPCLTYSAAPIAGAFHLRPAGHLASNADLVLDPPLTWRDGLPLLFPTEGDALGFDALAAAFFLLARVEEYQALPCDAHGRALTSAFHAARHGCLHRPVVDEWALLLAERWRATDPRVPLPSRVYKQVITVDLDNGFKYKGRALWRTLGAWARDAVKCEGHDVRERWNVLRGRRPDPFELEPELLDHFASSAQRRIAFILTAERSEWDHAVPVEHPAYTEYLRRLATRAEIGLHPSYSTSETEGRTARERDRLQRVIGTPIALSRQHFLRYRMPRTFREAIALGITEEHSMGCHDQLGFRAGTCTPFAWYDLERDAATDLLIHPFAVMDNTLRDKLRLDPAAAVDTVRPIIESVKRVKGTFTGLWHESFLATTGKNRAWRESILSIIREAAL